MKAGKEVFALGFAVVFVFLFYPSPALKGQEGVSMPSSGRPHSAASYRNPDYDVGPVPDVNPIVGFTVISDSNILAYTRTSILHSDGRHWDVLYRAGDRIIDYMSSDGKYVVFSPELLRFGATMTIAPLYVGVLVKHDAKYELADLTSFKIPLGHSPNDARFTGRGEGILTTIFEYANFMISANRNGRLAVRFDQHILSVGSNSVGAEFGSSSSQGSFPMVALNEGVLADVVNGVLQFTPMIDIYKRDVRSFELDEGLTSSTMFDSTSVFFLGNEKLFTVSKSETGKYKVTEDSKIRIRRKTPYGSGEGSIPVNDICSLLAMNDSDVYALTTTGSLLKGEYSRISGTVNDWEVTAVLPIHDKGILARINQNTMLIGGSSIVRYYVGGGGRSITTVSERGKVLDEPGFSVSMFDAGTTYGVGIGRFDRSSQPPWVYLVELSGQNKMYVDWDSYTFPSSAFDVADQYGVTGRSAEPEMYRTNYGIGVAIGDINEDGSDDIVDSYLNGSPVVLVNNGRGYFRNETSESGLNTDLMRSECITLADVNNDGYLDLFATSFVGSDRLFMNEGGGKFKEVTKECGLASKGKSISAVFGDLNGDGYPDLYVGRWNAGNSLYLNNGDGTFRDITNKSGTGCGQLHETNSILLADFNNDGKLDIFVGNREGGDRLFLNEGDGRFKDVSVEAGVADSICTYGSVYGDFENDGRLDLLVVGPTTVRFYRNTGNDRNGVPVFIDETSRFLPPSDYYSGYNTGAATFDLDGNGDLDAIVGQYQGHTMLLRNSLNSCSGKHRNFVEVDVEGDESDRDGIGSKVKLMMNGRMAAYREIMSTYGYASSSSRTQLFGITDPDARYEVEVDFPASGVKRVVAALPGTFVTVFEHTGLERDYFLARKDLTGLIMSSRFRRATVESISLFVIVLLLLSLKLPYPGKNRKSLGLKSRIGISASAMFVFAGMGSAAYAFEQIFYSNTRWITGSHDIVTDDLLPVFLTVLLTFVFVKSRGRKSDREFLRKEAYGRLHSLLRRFAHGEGPDVVLSRLGLFVENLEDLVGDISNRENIAFRTRMAADGQEVDAPIENPKIRFLAVVDEFTGLVREEIEEIVAVVGLIIDTSDHDNRLDFLRTTAGTLKESSDALLQKVRAIKAALTGKGGILKSDARMRRETMKDVLSIKSSLHVLKRGFDQEFIAEIGRIVAEEVAKYRGEYRDFILNYEDKSAGARGIVSEEELREIVTILIRNSIEAISSLDSPNDGKKIFVRVFSTAASIVIEEEDNGPGISVDNWQRVLSGDFTTKGSGHGFGLRYASSCLSKYGGEIKLDESGVGAKFIIEIVRAA